MSGPVVFLVGIAYVIAFAFLNRARGSKLYEHTTSTEIGRIVSMGGMALICALYVHNLVLAFEVFFFLTVSLIVWCTFGWDADWSAEIGNDPNHSKLWGFVRMCAHGATMTAIFTTLGLYGYTNAFYVAPFGMLQGLPYIFWGMFNRSTAIPRAEVTWGAFMGLMFFITFVL